MSCSFPVSSFQSAYQFRRDSVAPSNRCRSAAIVTLLLAVGFLAGCRHEKSGPPPRYAFVAFENLSGDPSLDWVGRGASELLPRSLQGGISNQGGVSDVLTPDTLGRAAMTLGERPAAAPGDSTTRAAAILAGANHIVVGYVERAAAGVRISASEEDIASHKTVRTLTATAASPFDALNLLAHQFSPQAGAPPTTNAEALRLYCTALQSTAAEASSLLEHAVTLDPAFGPAWVALVRTSVAANDRGAASRAIERARTQKLTALDQAWLDFESASLNSDPNASLMAIRKVSGLNPGDTGLSKSLAQTETSAGNFSQAAAVWKKLSANAPGDSDVWNQLGYALCWSGDYQDALSALREYGRLRPGEANPLDSLGDVHYWFGKFSDAATMYSAAYEKTPAFLNGGDLYKGAWAKFLAGDKSGGDTMFAKFRAVHEKANDPSIDLFNADWLYRTGRSKEARAMLGDLSDKKGMARPLQVRTAIAAELAVWDLLESDRNKAVSDLTIGGSSGLTPGDLVVRFAAEPSAPASEWEARAGHFFSAPQFAPLHLTALGYALILDGKKQAAIPVWEEIVKQSPGTDFFPRNILSALKGGTVEHSTPPDPVNLNQFAAVLYHLQTR